VSKRASRRSVYRGRFILHHPLAASHYLNLMPFLDGLLGPPVEVAVRRELIYPPP